MATVVWQHVRHIGCLLGFFKIFVLRKIAANFTEISRKHVFAASNMNMIKNSVRNTNKFSQKIYSFLFRTLIGIINYAINYK